MKKLMFLLLPLFLTAETSFISPLEYASQLYKNPRGIGCNHCHGEKGEGKLIARYKHKGIEKEFRGPSINQLSFNEFYTAMNRRNKRMPRYFLIKKEVQALFFYLNQKEDK